MRVHLDTDFGGDPDDACALAMLLGWPEVEIAGITTCLDATGFRAAYVAHVLGMVGRTSIPVAAGAGRSLSHDRIADPVLDDERCWPRAILPRRDPPGAAVELLAESIKEGATVIAIGPQTNLARLEAIRPGILGRARVVAMGGWVRPPATGFPPWGPAMDFNIQWDIVAAEVVFAAAGDLTLATLSGTLSACLREADLPRLRGSGPLGRLLAAQSEAHAAANGMEALGKTYPALPDDLLNVHYDPVACALAVGWPGARLVDERLRLARDGDVALFAPDPDGRPTRVLAGVDGEPFRDAWIAAVEAAQGAR